ncbi:hypothetical protein [Flaviflexus massiliensis]|uniref:hypothetical protein n=1 Tax=Flaviflexus massiliensis TaxID=1522309 RepID=UPI0006D5639F|nr:hypothetical protein [Flaviflexus massiliensis]
MAQYKPDHAGVAEWAQSQEMLDLLMERAEDGKRAAEAASGRWPDYQASFQTGSGTAPVGRRHETRAAALLINTHPSAGRIEWNHNIMNNAVAAIESGGG